MARPETLIPGNCYFTVAFYDNDLVLPMIDTLIYVGQENDRAEGRLWLFKQPDSPPDPDENAAPFEPPELIAYSDKQLHQIVDFNGLMQRLREVAVDHPLTPVPQTTTEPATAEDYGSISAQVDNFLSEPEILSLTMTIRFTDDGLSLNREEGGYGMGFYTHPRRDPDEESRILSLFASLELQPHISHLFDRGRTRALQFRIPGERDPIVELCIRALTEVHSMHRGDVLNYYPLKKSDVQRGR